MKKMGNKEDENDEKIEIKHSKIQKLITQMTEK